MSKVRVGDGQLSAYDSDLDSLRKEIDEIEATLRSQGATSFSTSYDDVNQNGCGSTDRFIITGYREQTEEEIDKAKREAFSIQERRVAQLEQELARLRK